MFLYSTFNTATKPVGDFWPFLRRKIMANNCEFNVLKYPIHGSVCFNLHQYSQPTILKLVEVQQVQTYLLVDL